MSGGAVRVPEGFRAVLVPDPARLALLDDDDLLDAMAAYEKTLAATAGMSAQAAGLLARRRRAVALDEVGLDASKTVRDRTAGEAEAAVVDEIRLATGLGLFDAVGRVRLGTASATRAGGMRAALACGACTWVMARAWAERTEKLAPELAAEIGAAALTPTRDGAALSYRTFRSRLDRLVTAHVPAEEQRDFDLSRRDAYATVTPHGTGEFWVSGSAERVTAAAQRIDAIARAVRRRGDGRTLGQLRSDVSLDLMLYGDIPGLATPVRTQTVFGQGPSQAMPARADAPASGRDDATGPMRADAPASGRDDAAGPAREDAPGPVRAHAAEGVAADGLGEFEPAGGSGGPGVDRPAGWEPPPDGLIGQVASWAAYFPGGLPPAQLRIVISAAALLGLNEEPGTLSDGEPLPAHIVRDLAYAAGSTWRRLVTDPLTGEAIELSSGSYTPPPRLREALSVKVQWDSRWVRLCGG